MNKKDNLKFYFKLSLLKIISNSKCVKRRPCRRMTLKKQLFVSKVFLYSKI